MELLTDTFYQILAAIICLGFSILIVQPQLVLARALSSEQASKLATRG